MADPTAWSQARLPNFADTILGSSLRGAHTGVLLSEERRNREKYSADKLLEAKTDSLKEAVINAHKEGDYRSMNTAISNLARYDEGSAKRLNDLFSGLDRTNASRSALNLMGAFISDEKIPQENLLRQSIEALDVDQDHPIMQTLLDIQNTPFDPAPDSKRNKKMALAIQYAKVMKLLPEGEGGEDRDDYWKQKNYELDLIQEINKQNNQRKQNDFREREINRGVSKDKESVRQFEIESNRLTPEKTQLYVGWQNEYENGMASYNKLLRLADNFDELERTSTTMLDNALTRRIQEMMDWDAPTKTGGFRTFFGRMLRKFMGFNSKEVDTLYTEYTRILNKMVTEDLKPPVSDKDITVMRRGYPEENANAAYLASFLRGMAKAQAIEAARAKAKADYLRDNKDVAGALDYWQKNKNKYIAEAFGISEEALFPPEGTDESNWSIPVGDKEYRQKGSAKSRSTSPAPGNVNRETKTPTIENLRRSLAEKFKMARDKAREIDPRGVIGILQRLQYDKETGAIGYEDDEGNFITLLGPSKEEEDGGQ